MTTLDVLVPHFEDAEGVKRSLASITAQSWTGDLRVVLLDDGSRPETFAEVEKAAAAFPLPLTLLRHSKNQGRPRARNRLLDAVDAPWLAWLDAGDVWAPEKLALQFEHFHRLRYTGEDADRVWITCNYDWRWTGAEARLVRQEVEQDQVKALLMGNSLRGYLWTILSPAETFCRIGRFDEDLPRLQDLDFFIRFAAAGGRLVKPPTERALAVYEKSDIGRNSVEIRRCNQRIFDKHRAVYERYGAAFMRMRRFQAELHAARFAMNNREHLRLARFMIRAFLTHPELALKKIAQGDVRP